MINDFPYTNLHALNLDWILQKVKEAENLEEEIEEAIETANAAEAAATAAGTKADQAVAAVANKVDKLTTTGLKAYTHNGSTQGEVGITDAATGNTIVQRDANGRFKAAAPSANNDVANKQYVDEHGLSPEALADVLTGSDTISVDINEGGDQVIVKLDQDVIDELDGKLDASKTALADTGALTTLASAPAAPRIVGINSGNRQFSITIGSGLSLSSSNVLTATGGGEGGNVPAPTSADANKVLTVNGDGTNFGWQTAGDSNAVQKVTNDNIVYGRLNAVETALPISTSSATANTIARRGTGGTLVVGTPSANNHAATKKYVDDSILTVQPWPIALISLTSATAWDSTSDWTDITTAVTYGLIKINPGSNEWYTPSSIKNMTSSIIVKTFNGTAFTTYTINSDGTYTTG